MQQILNIRTQGQRLYDITPEVRRSLGHLTVTGLLTLFVRHTSCSLLIQENADPEVQAGLAAFLSRLVPPSTAPTMSYLTHTYEGPDDMPAHIKAALLPTHLSIPVMGGQLALGTWQGIYLFEHREAPRGREIVLHLSS